MQCMRHQRQASVGRAIVPRAPTSFKARAKEGKLEKWQHFSCRVNSLEQPERFNISDQLVENQSKDVQTLTVSQCSELFY